MTTIVYHRGTFAWDSRITAGNSITTDKGMKRFVEDGHVFYMAGCTCDWPKLRQAYLTGKNLGNLEASAFVVGPDKVVYKIATEDDGRLWRSALEPDEPSALGSGCDHAITAIDCGLSPRDAVKMAIKRDKSSGGVVRVAKL